MPSTSFLQLQTLIKSRQEAEAKNPSLCVDAESKTNWDFANVNGKTLLDLATEEGLLDEVKELLALGANGEHGRYMANALYGGHLEVAKYLDNKSCSFKGVELHKITNVDAKAWYQAKLSAVAKETDKKDFHENKLSCVFDRMDGIWARFFSYEFAAPHLLALAELGDNACLQRYVDNGFIKALPVTKKYKLLMAAANNGHLHTLLLLCTVDGIDMNCSEQPYAETPLHIAAKLGDANLARFCFERKVDINKPDINKRTAIFYVKTKEMLELFLVHKPNLLIRDLESRSVLHVMALFAESDCVRRLLQVDEASTLIAEKNIYGYTAADIAYLNGRHLHGDLLLGNMTSPFKTGTHRLVNIAQGYLLNNFDYYLRLLRRNVDMPGGACNGLSILFGHYSARGMQDYYFAVLELIASWDGDEEKLSQPLATPLPVVKDPDVRVYATLGHLMEQWLNDIIWAQHSSLVPSISRYKQYHDALYFAEVVPLSQGEKWRYRATYSSVLFDYTQDKSTEMSYSISELEELFSLFSVLPAQTQIRVIGSQHATSVYIDHDGKCYFYDSNVSYRLPAVSNLTDAIKAIINFQFVLLGKFEKDARLPLRIFVARFPQAVASTYSPRLFDGNRSPINRYTRLHHAVMLDDMDALEAALTKNPSELLCKDRGGVTPYEAALLCDNKAALALMHAKVPNQVVSKKVLKDAIEFFANDAVMLHLQQMNLLDDFEIFIIAFDARNYAVMDVMLVDHVFNQQQIEKIRESLDKFVGDELSNYITARHKAAIIKLESQSSYKARL